MNPVRRLNRRWDLSVKGMTAVADWLHRRAEKRRSRRAFEALSDAQLKDIGLSRGETCCKVIRQFWD